MSFAKLGSEHLVNTTIGGDQYGSTAVQLTSGDIVVAWTDINGTAINVRGQILNSDGVTKDDSEFMLNTTLSGDQFDVALTALGNGGFAAGWTSSASWSNSPFDFADEAWQNHVVTQVFAADGDKVGGEDTHSLFIYDYSFLDDYLLPDIELTDHLQGSVALTANLASNSDDFDLIAVDEVHYTDHQLFLFTPPIANWVNYEGGENNIVRFSDDDAEILNNRVDDVTYAHNQSYSVIDANDPPGYPDLDRFHDPKAITLSDGTVITTYWREATSSNLGGVHVDISSEANTVRVGSSAGTGPALAELTNGNIVVVWTDTVNSSDGNEDIRGQIISADGTKIDGEFVVTNAAGSQWTPAVAALADGRFIVVWEDMAGDGSGSAIKAQVFTAAGDKSGEAFTVNTSTAEDQKFPTVTALANGDALVTWTDYYGSTPDIYSQVLDLQSYIGDSSAETVYGGSFDDHLDGGDGADKLYGRDGDDVFETVTPDDLSDGDVFHGGDGIDTLDFDDYILNWGGPPVLIGDNGTVKSVEVINLHGPTAGVGINSIELAIPLANSAQDGIVIVNGAQAQDFINGDRVNNTAVELHLNGGGGDDQLTGHAGIDVLNGGTGADIMEGGGGSDHYFVDSASDTVVEDSFFGGFDDMVTASIDYTLGSYVEHLTLDGSADLDGTGNGYANTIYGNDGSNTLWGLAGIDTIYGGDGEDRLHGGTENDTLEGHAKDDNLYGDEGDDTLRGGADDDELDGGVGADIMEGGTGDDLYVVDDAGDVVTELNNQGTADLIMSSIGMMLPAYVENLWLTGTANISAIGNLQGNVLVGNAGNNALTGVTGADSLYGFGGNDVLWGGADGDTIDGGEGIDTAVYTLSDVGVYADISANLYFGGHANGDTVTGIENFIGSSYDDVLVGYTGTNVLTGAAGDDALFGVDDDDILLGGKDDDTLTGGEGADILNGGEGVDTASYHTAAAAVTVSLTTGTGTGDALGDTFISIESLTGSNFADALTGDANANVLDGDGGVDTLQGLLGDDTYVVDNAADVILEIENEGNDTVNASASYDLAADLSVETLQTTNAAATTAIDLTGSRSDNTVRGNAGDNTLNGRGGSDVLEGLGGADTFLFNFALNAATNVDQIVDFDVTDDQIHLNDDTFGGLPLGTLSASAFVIGAAAADADDRIIYDSTTGALSFDADGAGGTAAIQFATLSVGLALTNNDFFVV